MVLADKQTLQSTGGTYTGRCLVGVCDPLCSVASVMHICQAVARLKGFTMLPDTVLLVASFFGLAQHILNTCKLILLSRSCEALHKLMAPGDQ